MRLKRKFNNTTLVNCYAPTEAEEDEYKKEFYLSLHDIIQQIPDYDTKVVLGDFNDQIGKEQWSEDIAGKETIHQTTNKNGSMLSNLAAANNFVKSSTKFKHKYQQK